MLGATGTAAVVVGACTFVGRLGAAAARAWAGRSQECMLASTEPSARSGSRVPAAGGARTEVASDVAASASAGDVVAAARKRCPGLDEDKAGTLASDGTCGRRYEVRGGPWRCVEC